MKSIFYILLLLSVQACSAKAAPPASHSHGGRVHIHSLPAIGAGHRHGTGAPGVLAQSTNNGGTVTSSVEYEKPRQSPRIPRPTTTNTIKGDVSCRSGESDCNICAANVQQQFSRAAAGQLRWRKLSWHFSWPQKYPPNGTRPLDVFDGKPAYPLGIPNKHIQGFARTNSAHFPFVGTHSHKRKGSVFTVAKNSNGSMSLASLQKSRGGHPSGIQVIGDFLIYGDGGMLIFKDINSVNQTRTKSIRITPKARFGYGGGLGLLRLSNNNLLVLTSGPGSQDKRPRYNYFYKVQTQNGMPQKLTLLSKSRSSIPANWPKNLGFSENLSLITECGTGDIYSVHTTGSSQGIGSVTGNGYWRLSKLVEQQGKLSLSPLSVFYTRQNMSSCNISSAATVYVNHQHKLEFYCHGFAKDPSGSTFNVLGSPSRNGRDKFDFKMGTL
ncbi:MAG: hypothetical protein L3J51_07370 [Cocleimonas sp.]|nr:hypothetical protein [Cocleimonas sp.]